MALDVCAAADVALDEAFGLQLGIGVGHGGAMHSQHGGQLAAGRDAVAGTQIACMHQGTQLIAQLNV
jgi:hypothetical protein